MNYIDPHIVPSIWEVGDVILDKYEVKEIFTGGGMGLVYRVHHRDWGMDLAVKSPRPEFFQTQQQIENFEREAETWVSLGLHQNTVSCYYVRRLGNIPRIFTEFVDGGSLADWIRSRKLYEGGQVDAMERVLDFAIQFAWGLNSAHEQGLIHQDVKPGNVLVNTDGTIKITDFGLAKARAIAGETLMSSNGQSILVTSGGMTPAYCSPEQANGKPLSKNTDIWSWAISVLEMFVGETPCRYGGQFAAEIFESYVESYNEKELMPRQLLELMRDCFQHDPKNRKQDILELAVSLEEIYCETVGYKYPRTDIKQVDLLGDSLNNRAIALLEIGRTEQAEAVFEQAIALDPTNPSLVYNLGMHLWRTGRKTDTAFLIELDQLKPSHNWLVWHLCALVHVERRDFTAAKHSIEHALRLRGKTEARISIKAEEEWNAEFSASQVAIPNIMTNGPVCLCADSMTVTNAGNGGDIHVWSLNTGERCHTFARHVIPGLPENAIPDIKHYSNLSGHIDRVNSICFDENGRHFVSSSSDNTLRLWDSVTTRCIRVFEGHTDAVFDARIIEGNCKFISASADKTLRLWDITTGSCLGIVKIEQKGGVSALCLSADARRCLTGSKRTPLDDGDYKVRIWNTETGECLHVLHGHKDVVTTVYYSDDLRLIASGSRDQTIRLWDAESGKCIQKLKGCNADISLISISKDNRWLLCQSDYGHSVLLFDINSGRCLRTFTCENNYATLFVSSNGLLALVSGSETELHIINLDPFCNQANALKSPSWLCRSTDINELIKTQLTFEELLCSAKEALSVFDSKKALALLAGARALPGYKYNRKALDLQYIIGKSCQRLAISNAWCSFEICADSKSVHSVAISGDGKTVISGGEDGLLRVWSRSSGTCLHEIKANTGGVDCLCISTDAVHAITGGNDKMLHFFDVIAGKCVRSFEGQATVDILSILDSSKPDNFIKRLFHRKVEKPDFITSLQKLTLNPGGHEEWVSSVCMSHDKQFALSGSGDKSMRLWETSSGRCIRTFPGHTLWINSVFLSADSRIAVSGCGGDSTLRVWDVATRTCVQTIQTAQSDIKCVALTVDCRKVVTASRDGSIKLWDLQASECLVNMIGSAAAINAICLSFDNRFLVSGGEDAVLRVWDLTTGKCLYILEGHAHSVRSVSITNDCRWVVSGSADGMIRLWELDWEYNISKSSNNDWVDDIMPFLVNFLTIHTPYVLPIPSRGELDDRQIQLALTRKGVPSWSNQSFSQLLRQLEDIGYGWVSSSQISCELNKLMYRQ